ncbi:hypothetical protein [Rhizobium leguminosarum]|uniref:hypothetical protein n=1 Tax=Rhizobium leguminosarum TaxID=384 RepID=UPI001C95121B|nr:hypothetical protein [Rhizobium leguminosarum]MBY5579141.1 hypothetical protein [Rhizobium leguminosarum]
MAPTPRRSVPPMENALAPATQRPAIPVAMEMASIRIDGDVLAFFQSRLDDRRLLSSRSIAGKARQRVNRAPARIGLVPDLPNPPHHTLFRDSLAVHGWIKRSSVSDRRPLAGEVFLSELGKLKEAGTVDDFRLSNEPFFLKFCPRIQFDPDSSGVTKGMYVPLSYWKRRPGAR